MAIKIKSETTKLASDENAKARASTRSKSKKTTANSAKPRQPTKQDRIITLLKRSNGATLAELGKASDWQEHSIRGFMSGTLKKRLKLNVVSRKDDKGPRRYQIAADKTSSNAVEKQG